MLRQTPGTPTGFATMSRELANASNYHRWLFSLVRPWLGRVVLECGTGNGIMTRALAASGAERVYSTDIDPRCLEPLRRDPALARVEFEVHDLGDDAFAEAYARRGVDTIVHFNVLEHVSDDAGALARLARVLVPGGRLLLFVPAFPCLYGGMDEAAGHYRRYTRAGLSAALRAAGLRVGRADYVNPLGFLGWWANNRLVPTRDLDAPRINAQIGLFDRYILPLSVRLEPLFRRLAGQSLFCVAVR